jgi:hypothetical protein
MVGSDWHTGSKTASLFGHELQAAGHGPVVFTGLPRRFVADSCGHWMCIDLVARLQSERERGHHLLYHPVCP